MSDQKKSIEDLLGLVKAAEEKQEFDIAADLQELLKQYRRLKASEYKTLLGALLEKYTAGEYNVVHAALLAACQKGDMKAIHEWNEMRQQGGGGSEGVTIIDDIH